LIKISREESKLLSKLGVPYGENGISHTHGHKRNYYLCESRKNLSLLSQLRAERLQK
jgi:hypothetical protein